MLQSEFKLVVPNEFFKGKELDKYLVVAKWKTGEERYRFISKVVIVENQGRIYYNVYEPYSEFKSRVEELLRESKFWLKPVNKCLSDPVGYCLEKISKNCLVKGDRLEGDLYKAVEFYLAREILGYGCLTTLIYDSNVEDISCIGPSLNGSKRFIKVWHRIHNGLGWLTTNIELKETQLDEVVGKLVYKSGESVSVMNPIVEGVLPEGYRINISYGKEVSDFGSSFTIRKFRSTPYTITELIRNGTIDDWTASYLWLMMEFKGFTLIMGASGSGKTTLLNAICSLANPNWKLVSIEDVREINLCHDGWKPLKTRVNGNGLEGEINLFDLVKFALRERPDFLILGESRGEEARMLFQGAAAGTGAITTFHSSSIESLIARLTNDPISVGESMINLLDTVIHIVVINRGDRVERKVNSVYENHLNQWVKIVEWRGGASWIHRKTVKRLFERAKNYGFREDDVLRELERRRRFLNYLVRINAFTNESINRHLKLFYSGRLNPDGLNA